MLYRSSDTIDLRCIKDENTGVGGCVCFSFLRLADLERSGLCVRSYTAREPATNKTPRVRGACPLDHCVVLSPRSPGPARSHTHTAHSHTPQHHKKKKSIFYQSITRDNTLRSY